MLKNLLSTFILCGLMAGVSYGQQPYMPPMPIQALPPAPQQPPMTYSQIPQDWRDGFREEYKHVDIHEVRPIREWNNYQQYQQYPQYQQYQQYYPQNYNYYPQQQSYCYPQGNTYCYPQQYECRPYKESWIPWVLGGR